jgi:hypothetical protein
MKIYSDAVAQPEEINQIELRIKQLCEQITTLENETTRLKSSNMVSIITDAVLFGLIFGNLIIIDYFVFFTNLLK